MEGIIYKTQPYKEHARLLFVYTPKGKKTLVAQGSQKVTDSTRILSQYLTHIEFKDQDKSFYNLSESKIVNDFGKIKEDFKHTQSAALILEIIDHLFVDEVEHAAIFQEVILALNAEQIELSSLSFAVKILKPLGYELNLNADGRKVIGVNIERGSVIYQGMTDVVDLTVKEAIYLLKLLMVPYQMLEDIPKDILHKIKHFILTYYQYHLQTTLKNLQ